MTHEREAKFYEQLEQLTGEQVLRAFTHWHGTQLLTDDFLEFCIEEDYIESNIEYIDETEEEDEDAMDELEELLLSQDWED